MTQRKFVFMKFEDSLFLHFSEFFGEGAPVEVQVVGEALAVEGDRKGVGAGFGRLRGEVDQHALADRLWCSAENAVGEDKIFLHGDAEHVTAKLGQPCIITIGGLVEVSKIEKRTVEASAAVTFTIIGSRQKAYVSANTWPGVILLKILRLPQRSVFSTKTLPDSTIPSSDTRSPM